MSDAENFRPLSEDSTHGEADANLAALAALIPGAVVDGELDNDALRDFVGQRIATSGPESFGLRWPGMGAARVLATHPATGTLLPEPERSVNWEHTQNIAIEGDNLEVLRLLRRGYTGKVDMIYIDPPYNLDGDFVYDDFFGMSRVEIERAAGIRDEDGSTTQVGFATERGEIHQASGARHAKWLSMMYPRLIVAQQLLKPSGVIFVQIDDTESARLRLLLDRVFGAENFIDTIVVEMSTTQGMKVKAAQLGTITKNVEFIHIYQKSDEFGNVSHTPLLDEVQGWPGNFTTWLDDDLQFYPLADELNKRPELVAEARRLFDDEKVRISHLNTMLLVSEPFKKFVEENLSHIAASDKGVLPAGIIEPAWRDGQAFEVWSESRPYIIMKSSVGTIRQFLLLKDNYRESDGYEPRFGRTVIRGDLWRGFVSDMAHVNLEGGVDFKNGKKPTRLIRQLFRWANNRPDTLIMDFFAGSGSTAHAVMELNAGDKGNRRFITIQLDSDAQGVDAKDGEKVSDRMFARLINAGNEIKAEHPEVDTGFRAYQLADANVKPWDGTAPLDLYSAVDNVRADRSTDDLLVEMMLRMGIDLITPIEQREVGGSPLYNIGGTIFAYFGTGIDNAKASEVAKQIVAWRDADPVDSDVSVVVRDNGFKDSVAKRNMWGALLQAGFQKKALRSI